MQMDCSTLYDAAAQHYALEAAQRREDAETKRQQMSIAPIDWQLVLLNEAIILDKAAGYLAALAEDLRGAAETYRDPL